MSETFIGIFFKGGEIMARQENNSERSSGWVFGFTAFAGTVMIISGLFQFFEGLAAILRQDFYIVGHNYAFYLNVNTWGWIHLIVGLIVGLAGFYVFSGRLWARIIGIILATISAIANFFYIPYYPLWSILIIALDIAVIWALTVYRHA